MSKKKGRVHTNSELQRIISDIRQLMEQGKTDNEIRGILGLEVRQYQRFVKSINLQNQKAWYFLVKNELATQLLALRNSLEETFTKSRELANIPGSSTTDVPRSIKLTEFSKDIHTGLLVEGTELLTKQQQAAA